MPCCSQWSIGHRPSSPSSSVLSCRLHLPPAKPEARCPHLPLQISFPRVSWSVGRPLSLWHCGVHCSTCLAMLSSLLLSVWPVQFHFLLLSWSRTGSSFVFFHSSLLVILSGQCTGWAKKVIPLVHYITLYERCIFRILLRHLLIYTWTLSTVLCVTVQDSDA